MKKLLLGLAAALLLAGATTFGASLVGAQGQRRIDAFTTRMAAHSERPPVDSKATGRAIVVLDRQAREINYVLWVRKIDHITESHIHVGSADRNVTAPRLAGRHTTTENATAVSGALKPRPT